LSSRLARSSKGLHGHYRNDDGLRQNRGGERIEICALDRGEPFALAVGARGQSTNISFQGSPFLFIAENTFSYQIVRQLE